MKKRYSEDLDYFLKKLQTKHIYLFHDKSLDDINKFIKNYKNKINNDLDYIYFLNCIMKFINNSKDSHSKCRFKSNKSLPFMFKFLNNKLYIVGSNSLYSSYLYKDVISINGISIIKLIKEMRDAISYTTIGHLNSEIEANFSSVNGIRYLPSIDSNTTNLVFKFSDGSTIELDIDKIDSYVLERENYLYDIQNNKLILKYITCKDMDAMNNFIKSISKLNNYNTIILDIRGNGGGDSSINIPLIDFIKNKNLKTIVLTDYMVYSSATFIIDSMVNYNATFIGSEIGTTMNHYGNVSSFKLPNTDIIVNYSTKYFYYINGEFSSCSKRRELKKLEDYRFKSVHFRPDILLDNDIFDIMNHRDKVMERALSYEFEE